MRVQEIFDKFAKDYDEWYDRNRDLYLKELEIIDKPQGFSLEIGVGSGRFASELKINVGIDISKEILKIAKERGVEVVRGDAANLPFKDCVFDTAYMIFTLCFLENPESSLSEAQRVIKNGGKLFVCIIPADSELGEIYSKRDSPFYRAAKFFKISEAEDLLKKYFKITKIRKRKLLYSDNDFVCFECLKLVPLEFENRVN